MLKKIFQHCGLDKLNKEENFPENFFPVPEKYIIYQTGSEKKSQIYIKALKVIDEELDVIAESKDWPDCLSKALVFYKQLEDYESCAKCQKILDKINIKPKKKNP